MFGSYEQFFSYKNSLNVFTWTILSTLDSRAANNFSLIFFFFLFQSSTRNTRQEFVSRGKYLFLFRFIDEKQIIRATSTRIFSILSEKKKSFDKSLKDYYMNDWRVDECVHNRMKKKKSAHCYLCREKILFYILFTKWAVINKIKENKKKTKKTSKYKLETKVIILLIFKAN